MSSAKGTLVLAMYNQYIRFCFMGVLCNYHYQAYQVIFLQDIWDSSKYYTLDNIFSLKSYKINRACLYIAKKKV